MGIHNLRKLMNNPKRKKKQKGQEKDSERSEGGDVPRRPADSAEVCLKGGWATQMKGKIIGVDISVLFHNIFGFRHTAGQLLCVDPETSVFPLVCESMNAFFKNHALHMARGVVFVHDPKLVDKFHCDHCRGAYTEFMEIKYRLTGREKHRKNQDQMRLKWDEIVAKYNTVSDAQAILDLETEFPKLFKTHFKGTNCVTQPLHNAFVKWVADHNDRVTSARALKEKMVTSKSRKRKATTGTDGNNSTPTIKLDHAAWPLMVCINSPVEADDQLKYLQQCGFVDQVMSVDSDLLAMGCFNMISKGLGVLVTSKSPVFGYSRQSVFNRICLLCGVGQSEFAQLSPVKQSTWMRGLLCLLSCVVGNDYVVGALDPDRGGSDVVKEFVQRKFAGESDGTTYSVTEEDVYAVAETSWAQVTSNSKKKKVKETYGQQLEYQKAFARAFAIYYDGRYWQFSEGTDIPKLKANFEDFVNGHNFTLESYVGVQPGGRSVLCHGHSVPHEVFYVKCNKRLSYQMGTSIDFNLFPPVALPRAVLGWWLLAHGCEIKEDLDRADMLRLVARFRDRPSIAEPLYRTTFSTILQSMMRGTPRIPCLAWSGKVDVWMATPNCPGNQELASLRLALNRCDFMSMTERALSNKECRKTSEMERSGQVMWKNMLVRTGRADVGAGIDANVVQFSLQCVPSLKSDLYLVEIVFSASDANSQFHLNEKFSYCNCKKGAVDTDVCSHRRAVVAWLGNLQHSWRTKAETDVKVANASNFVDLAAALGLASDILHVSQLPLSVPQVQKLHLQAAQEIKWTSKDEDDLFDEQRRYLMDPLARDAGKRMVCRIAERLEEMNDVGKFQFSKFQMGASTTMFILDEAGRGNSPPE